jgi:hypothetical protein
LRLIGIWTSQFGDPPDGRSNPTRNAVEDIAIQAPAGFLQTS